jgi:hypothetical protein
LSKEDIMKKSFFALAILSLLFLSGCASTMGMGGMGGMNTQRMQQAQYNPCDNMATQIATDTAAAAIAGALINSRNRGQGAGIGAGAGLAGSYAIRNSQCESYKQQEYYRQEALRQQAAAIAQQNAPRTNCRAERQVDRYGNVVVTENCNAQETRSGYRNW